MLRRPFRIETPRPKEPPPRSKGARGHSCCLGRSRHGALTALGQLTLAVCTRARPLPFRRFLRGPQRRRETQWHSKYSIHILSPLEKQELASAGPTIGKKGREGDSSTMQPLGQPIPVISRPRFIGGGFPSGGSRAALHSRSRALGREAATPPSSPWRFASGLLSPS